MRAYLAWAWGVSREFLREAVPVVHLQVGVGQQGILDRYPGERRGAWPGGSGGGSRQSRGGHSMPGGEAQVSPRTEQISRELNPPGSQRAKNRFQAAVLKVWPRNHQDHRGSHSRESGRPNHFHDYPQDACAFFSSVLSQAYSGVSQ